MVLLGVRLEEGGGDGDVVVGLFKVLRVLLIFIDDADTAFADPQRPGLPEAFAFDQRGARCVEDLTTDSCDAVVSPKSVLVGP